MPCFKRGGIHFEPAVAKGPDLGVIRGQVEAKGAAYVAAAGGHNLLLIGPPGEGKSLLASALPGILPRLTDEEKVQLTRIYSAYGALDRDGLAVSRRPMRTVHHTASKQSLIGGGSGVPRPGEITMAHLGVLFLDEIAEFSGATLDALRQPLEAGEVTIARVGATLTYPCRFTLVAAMNPCPCGHYGTGRCRCKEAEVRKYQKKISGPILDRIDLQVQLGRLSTEERFAETDQNVSPKIRANVEAARARQVKRFEGTGIPLQRRHSGGTGEGVLQLLAGRIRDLQGDHRQERHLDTIDGSTGEGRSDHGRSGKCRPRRASPRNESPAIRCRWRAPRELLMLGVLVDSRHRIPR